MATRNAHLAYIDTKPIDIILAGPLSDDAGGMRGSLFIVEADDPARCATLQRRRPVSKGGAVRKRRDSTDSAKFYRK